jgi:hypothetical protein
VKILVVRRGGVCASSLELKKQKEWQQRQSPYLRRRRFVFFLF